MITTAYIRTMARYNQWQNDNLYNAADRLDDTARRADRGAFFGSITGTFSHLIWADLWWMHRLAGTEKPAGGLRESASFITDWMQLRSRRTDCDAALIAWADGLPVDWADGQITMSAGGSRAAVRIGRALAVTHVFNHQTHHRGQVHAMLTAAGARPGDTDLMLLPGGPEG